MYTLVELKFVEKAIVTMKPDKLKTAKTAKTAGKKRKASADPELVAWASKDLKQNSAMKGNEIKKNQMTQGKQHAAAADHTTKKLNHILTDEEIRQCCEWPNHILTDEEIKQIRESSKYEIEKGFPEYDAREVFMMKSTLIETMASLLHVPISKLKPPSLSVEEGYKTDGSYFDCFKVVPGPYYTPDEPDDSLDKVGMVMKEYAFPQLKLDDD